VRAHDVNNRSKRGGEQSRGEERRGEEKRGEERGLTWVYCSDPRGCDASGALTVQQCTATTTVLIVVVIDIVVVLRWCGPFYTSGNSYRVIIAEQIGASVHQQVFVLIFGLFQSTASI
jgi:hypothetical protein